MKKSLLLLLAPAMLFITSCGGDDEKKENGDKETTEDIDLEGMVGDDTLKTHGLDATIWIPEELAPDGTQIPSDIDPDPDNMIWKLKSGKRFHVVIRITDGEGNYIKRKKEELAGSIYKIEYLEDNKDYIMYRATIPDGNNEYFKFYGVKKVKGEEYEYYSEESTEMRKIDVEQIKKSFLAFGEEIVEE